MGWKKGIGIMLRCIAFVLVFSMFFSHTTNLLMRHDDESNEIHAFYGGQHRRAVYRQQPASARRFADGDVEGIRLYRLCARFGVTGSRCQLWAFGGIPAETVAEGCCFAVR